MNLLTLAYRALGTALATALVGSEIIKHGHLKAKEQRRRMYELEVKNYMKRNDEYQQRRIKCDEVYNNYQKERIRLMKLGLDIFAAHSKAAKKVLDEANSEDGSSPRDDAPQNPPH